MALLTSSPTTPQAQAAITIRIDGKVQERYQLNKPRFTIGRFPGSDIQIASPRVSRFHGTIRWVNNAWVIEDAQSLNGLICEGQRIDQLALVDGDIINLDANIVLHYTEEK